MAFLHTGKCPKCDQEMPYIQTQSVQARVLSGSAWSAISYQCPLCLTVISVATDPIAVKAEIVSEILRARGKRSP